MYHLVTVPRQQPVRSHIMRRCRSRNAKSAPDSDPFKPFQSQNVGMFLERGALLQAKNARNRLSRNPDVVSHVAYWFMALASAAIQPEHAFVVNVTLLLLSIIYSLLNSGQSRP
ncbi:hypothetical protein B9Z19DRAFT_1074643 [Tuber borchii]|uniref:Uncharacterized protein n=1 Tax=Tuber borchii TaxID=42251 RepID=A0A2T7A4A8_TUBBO|nr:hypothetical protein B9Z19DRAFT_1074643 [Tuber borchii]